MEQSFGQEWYANNFDEYLRDYITIYEKNWPRIWEEYEEYKDFFWEWEKTKEELLKDLEKYSKYYVRIALWKDPDKELNKLWNELKIQRIWVSLPFLMRVYCDYEGVNGIWKLSKEDFIEIINTVLSYVYRRYIVWIPTNSLNKTFALLYNSVKLDDYRNSVLATLMLLDSYKEFPNDEEFKQSFTKKDMYNTRLKNYTLEKLENHNHLNNITIDWNDISIEHILPETDVLKPHWQAVLWENWKELQKDNVHRIWNLTITKWVYNSKMSDLPFREKLEVVWWIRDSHYRLSNDVVDKQNWSIPEIDERSKKLAEQACNIWKFPNLSEQEITPYKNLTISKKENIIYEIENINNFSYFGEKNKDINNNNNINNNMKNEDNLNFNYGNDINRNLNNDFNSNNFISGNVTKEFQNNINNTENLQYNNIKINNEENLNNNIITNNNIDENYIQLQEMIKENERYKEINSQKIEELQNLLSQEKDKNEELIKELNSLKLYNDDLNKNISIMKQNQSKMNKKNVFTPKLFLKLFFRINHKIFSSPEYKKYLQIYNLKDIYSIYETFKITCDSLKRKIYETHFEINTTNTNTELDEYISISNNNTRKPLMNSSYRVVNERILKLKKFEFDMTILNEFIKNYMVSQESVIQIIFNSNNNVIQFEIIEKLYKLLEDGLNFKIEDIYVMDSSKRSSKANAYFTGWGKRKRIVLYDTLINTLTTDEIVADLDHEIGHDINHHTIKSIFSAAIQNLIIFSLLGIILKYDVVAQAMGCQFASFHINALVFFLLFKPVSECIDIVTNIISRRHEYQADNFVKENGKWKIL